jgi:cytoskeletal protein CcmA (bactofilin family)
MAVVGQSACVVANRRVLWSEWMLIIEADMVVKGDVTILGVVRLDGRFEGRLACTRLEIGRDGYLYGTVIAEVIVVAGQIVGHARGREIHLEQSAIVEADLVHEQLRMDENASLVGESRRERKLAMSSEYVALLASARQSDEEFSNQQTQTRVRLAAEAERDLPQFQRLRARFPTPASA